MCFTVYVFALHHLNEMKYLEEYMSLSGAPWILLHPERCTLGSFF